MLTHHKPHWQRHQYPGWRLGLIKQDGSSYWCKTSKKPTGNEGCSISFMMGWPAHAHTMTRAKCGRSCGVRQTLNYCGQNDSHSSVPAVSCLRKSYSLCGGDERVSNINLSVSCCLPVWCTVFRPECTYNWFCNYSVFIDFKSKRGVPNCSDTALLSNLDPRRSFMSRLYHCTIYIYTVFTEQFLVCFLFCFVFNCYVWKMKQ